MPVKAAGRGERLVAGAFGETFEQGLPRAVFQPGVVEAGEELALQRFRVETVRLGGGLDGSHRNRAGSSVPIQVKRDIAEADARVEVEFAGERQVIPAVETDRRMGFVVDGRQPLRQQGVAGLAKGTVPDAGVGGIRKAGERVVADGDRQFGGMQRRKQHVVVRPEDDFIRDFGIPQGGQDGAVDVHLFAGTVVRGGDMPDSLESGGTFLRGDPDFPEAGQVPLDGAQRELQFEVAVSRAVRPQRDQDVDRLVGAAAALPGIFPHRFVRIPGVDAVLLAEIECLGDPFEQPDGRVRDFGIKPRRGGFEPQCADQPREFRIDSADLLLRFVQGCR